MSVMASRRNPPQVACVEKGDWYNLVSRLAGEIRLTGLPLQNNPAIFLIPFSKRNLLHEHGHYCGSRTRNS